MTRGTRAQHGFTLIEVLVSVAIFSVITVAVYSAFAGGVGAWRRAQEFSSTYQTVRLVLEDMAQELKNAVTSVSRSDSPFSRRVHTRLGQASPPIRGSPGSPTRSGEIGPPPPQRWFASRPPTSRGLPRPSPSRS
jgi:prepilin-type N-terminal cleavage/methylation domain-containing protein